MTSRTVQYCDDATAARLEAEGYTIDRNAMAGCHHGAYSPHIAWKDDGPSICGARVPSMEEAEAIACPHRNDKCQAAAYCYPDACRAWRASK